MNIDTKAIGQHLKQFNFSELFTQELGWDWYDAELPQIEANGRRFGLAGVAEKRGMVVVECTPNDEQALPDYAVRKKIENQVTKRHYEHLLIFTDSKRKQQVWQFSKREHGKTVKVRELIWHQGTTSQDLIQRLGSLAINLGDEDKITLQDVTQRAQSQMDVEKVTKKFYQLFDKQKNAFTKAIAGIGAQDDQQWYASVMLNRLMFIYFVQKKGFLNGDHDYLRTKLAECQMRLGQDQFHDFYRSFLMVLFHDGLNKRPEEHTQELKDLVGKVPYLNGGIFDIHKIEETYGDDIDIPDDAFEKIFDFFDGYRWHLDDRPIVQGNEINPDVLGYIFEKYINQKQMGAYYTKEDITGYISKNTIIPHLFDRVASAKGTDLAYAFDLLKEDPDRYIYDAVKHGWAVDIHQKDKNGQSTRLDSPYELPEDIAAGLDDLEDWDLIERRKCWNRPAPPEVALPTEIWREVVHRRQRYFDLKAKLENRDVREISDFITLNLNITVFARDAIDRCPNKKTLAEFWKALTGMTVLDPTCGSGAFLFAALEILEPLYEVALKRMDRLLHDLKASGKKPHRNSHEQRFQDILAEIAKPAHPNRSYFILKSIIVQNLYGVDIMEEAVEICKLRLFLKLAAQVEPRPRLKNYGIEPLPDIDFNIKAGNTLVGFATEADVKAQMPLGDEMETILNNCQDIEQQFKVFVQSQIENDAKGLRKVKKHLRNKLTETRQLLDVFLARTYGIDAENETVFSRWRESHQPFHWFCEFFSIMNQGGFDVVIGNPPYVEYSKVKNTYTVASSNLLNTGNLYSICCERFTQLMTNSCLLGVIVPISCISTPRMVAFYQHYELFFKKLMFSNFAVRPSKLFVGVDMNLTIILGAGIGKEKSINTTNYLRWNAEARDCLFSSLSYQTVSSLRPNLSIPKIGSEVEANLFSKIFQKNSLSRLALESGPTEKIYIHSGGRYFRKCIKRRLSNEYKPYEFPSAYTQGVIAALSSSLYYWIWISYSDTYHVVKGDVHSFPIATKALVDYRLIELSNVFLKDIEANAKVRIRNRADGSVQKEVNYQIGRSKHVMDEIDKALAPHYGFTPEELDFIINYDIKYRMGLGNLADANDGD